MGSFADRPVDERMRFIHRLSDLGCDVTEYTTTGTRSGGTRREDEMDTICDRCGEQVTEEATLRGWPIPMSTPGGEVEYICPSCYGDEAFCPQGHVLPADTDTDDCPTCEEEEKATPPA